MENTEISKYEIGAEKIGIDTDKWGRLSFNRNEENVVK